MEKGFKAIFICFGITLGLFGLILLNDASTYYVDVGDEYTYSMEQIQERANNETENHGCKFLAANACCMHHSLICERLPIPHYICIEHVYNEECFFTLPYAWR